MNKTTFWVALILLTLSFQPAQSVFPQEQSVCTFAFPAEIQYQMEKGASPLSTCTISYEKYSPKPGLSSLQLKMNSSSEPGHSASFFYQTTQIIFASYIYEHNAIASQLHLQEAKSILSRARERILLFSEPKKYKYQKELFADHQVIDTLLCYFLASKRVAECAFRENKQYSFYIDGKVKNVFMVHLGSEETPYNGRPVPTELMALTFNNRLIFEMNIHKDQNGYTYPIKITIKDPHQNNQNALQLKATKINPPSPEKKKPGNDSEVFPVDG